MSTNTKNKYKRPVNIQWAVNFQCFVNGPDFYKSSFKGFWKFKAHYNDGIWKSLNLMSRTRKFYKLKKKLVINEFLVSLELKLKNDFLKSEFKKNLN